MIGSTNLDFEAIRRSIDDNNIVNYSDSLVPSWARHIRPIVFNQRYYLAVNIRSMLTIPFKVRQGVAEELIKDIFITGVVSEFVQIGDIVQACNKEMLVQAVKEMLEND